MFVLEDHVLISGDTVVISRDPELVGDRRLNRLLVPLPVPHGLYKKILKGRYDRTAFYVRNTSKAK